MDSYMLYSRQLVMKVRFKIRINYKTKHTSFPESPWPGCLLLMFCRSRNQGGSSFGQGCCWWTKSCTTLVYKTLYINIIKYYVLGSWDHHYRYLSSTVTKLGNFTRWSGRCFSCIWLLECLNRNILRSYSPPETWAPLLQRHNIQLQHRGPHQPLLTVEMRPT